MKKLFWVLLGVGFVFSQSIACDVCGVSASGNGIGWIDNLGKTQIRFVFASYQFKGNNAAESTYQDRFQTRLIFGQFRLNQKWTLTGALPYAINDRIYEEDDLRIKGFSDANLGVKYIFLNQKKLGEKGMIFLEGGLSLSSPSGKYISSIHDFDLPDNFNPGKGTFGFNPTLMAVYTIDKRGLLMSASFTQFLQSQDGYRFGHQIINELQIFQGFSLKEKWNVVGKIGGKMENVSSDKYANKMLVPDTGAMIFLGTTGFLIGRDTWNIGGDIGIPFYQNLGADNVKAGFYGQIHCSFAFSTKNKKTDQ